MKAAFSSNQLIAQASHIVSNYVAVLGSALGTIGTLVLASCCWVDASLGALLYHFTGSMGALYFIPAWQGSTP